MDTTNHPTRKSRRPNPIWAKVMNGARHFGDPHALLSKGEKKVLREQRDRHEGR